MRRRQFLAGSAALAASSALAAELPRHAGRAVAIDWGLAETVIALGAPLVGLAESAGYRQWVSVPALPPEVAEIGLRSTPNLEAIAALGPDVILSTPQFAAIEPVLAQVAPVLNLATYTETMAPVGNAIEITGRLGALFGRPEPAERLVARTQARIAAARSRDPMRERRETLVVNFHDDRHLWVFTQGSLYHDVMARAGLVNAWKGPGNAWGIANATVDQLVGLEHAAVLVVEPMPPSIRMALRTRDPGTLVGQMALFEPGAYRILPPNWGFGALPSAGRFADALAGLASFIEAADG